MTSNSRVPLDEVMGLARAVYRTANRALSRFGLALLPVAPDLDAYPVNGTLQQALFSELAAIADAWLARQSCFEAVPFDTEAAVREFFFSYLEGPFRSQYYGSRFNNALWLALLARAYNPETIVESGTFEGASAWALKFGAPGAEVLSFDIDMSRVLSRTPGVEYLEQDWTTFDLASRAGKRTLIYFDDHLDQARRLLEAHERKIGLAIFDDDFPAFPAVSMANGGKAFPKIEFVLNDALRQEKEIVWKSGKETLRWPVDAAYLDRARRLIAATDRLPNTSLVTGIHQTPYRIVKIEQKP